MQCDPKERYSQLDLIRNSMEAVAFSKFNKDYPCRYLHSFAYVDSWEDMNLENLGHALLLDQSREYAYVRNKEELFPALIISPINSIPVSMPFENVRKEKRTYEILVIDDVDMSQLGCSECSKCQRRTYDEVKADMLNLWYSWMDYIRGANYYEVETPDGVIKRWANRDHMASAETLGGKTVNSFTESYGFGKEFLLDMRRLNTNIELKYATIGKFFTLSGRLTFEMVVCDPVHERNLEAKLNNQYLKICQ